MAPSRPAPASFEPFPSDLDIQTIVDANERFQFAERITCDSIGKEPIETLERLVFLWVVLLGKPLVLDGFQEFIDKRLFSPEWLKQNHHKSEVPALILYRYG